METQIFLESPGEIYNGFEKEVSSIRDKQYSIEMFLNVNVLFNEAQEKQQTFITDSAIAQQKTDLGAENLRQAQGQPASNTKSIFHNFQKHLITLLKRIVKIKGPSLKKNGDYKLASSLWAAFVKSRNYSKKIMQSVFGPDCHHASLQSWHLAFKEFREFKYLFNKYSAQEIVQAQKKIRQVVVCQLWNLSKTLIKANTKISRFDQFYEYFLAFLQEIESGSMSQRLSKTRKATLISKISQRGSEI